MPARIKRIFANREVYEKEGIHIQCLVDYHEPKWFDQIVVEVHRSLFNSTETQVLSSNGEVQRQPPEKQFYDAYIAENGPTSKEHAFKISNVNIKNDSGDYECLVKQNGSVIDRKHVPVRVVLEEPEDFLEFFTRASIPGYLSGQTDDLQVVEETLPSNLKCKNERQSKSNGFDLSTPVVCDPKAKTGNPLGTQQELGLSTSLLCIAEAHPPPKVEWYKETVSPEGTKILEKIHMSAKYATAIDEFRDFYQLVSLTINQVEQSDYGVYVCAAANSEGDKDSMKIRLEKPSKPTLKVSSAATPSSFRRINYAFAYFLPTIFTLFIIR